MAADPIEASIHYDSDFIPLIQIYVTVSDIENISLYITSIYSSSLKFVATSQ